MAIPIGGLTVANLDAGTDRPDLSRVELLAGIQKINEILAKLPLYADGEQSGTGTQRFGNIAVGGTLRAWGAGITIVDIAAASSIYATSIEDIGFATNCYFDGTNWRYIANGFAAIQSTRKATGLTDFFTAPSGLTGNIVTLVKRFSIENNGTTKINDNIVRHNGNVFHGRVDSAGAAIRLPSGWTSSLGGTGVYTITHNLGTNLYSISATAYVSDVAISAVSNTTTIVLTTTVASTGVAFNSAFNFMVIMD